MDEDVGYHVIKGMN